MVDATIRTYPQVTEHVQGTADPYRGYAAVYDLQGQDRWSERMAAFVITDLLPRYGAQPRSCLDLACGTGTAALRFAQHGYDVTGVDGSAPMLAAARQKAADARLPVRFVEQDMRDLTIATPVDMLTCFYDSLNYLTDPADLARTFVRIRAALAPDGLAVFDLNTTAGLAADWDNRCWVREIDGTFFIEQAEWDAGTALATLTLTCFVRLGPDYRRFEEVHTERGYTVAEVTDALDAAGLTLVDAFACLRGIGPTFEPPGEDTHRVVFVARP